MRADLTHAEALAAFDSLAKSIKHDCYMQVGLRLRAWPIEGTALTATFWPGGLTSSGAQFTVDGETWRELLANVEAKWAEHADLHGANVIREMALAIITITADLGECTDAALRAQFDGADVAKYGDRACVRATEMASNGPFSIVKLSGANDAEAA